MVCPLEAELLDLSVDILNCNVYGFNFDLVAADGRMGGENLVSGRGYIHIVGKNTEGGMLEGLGEDEVCRTVT